MRNLVYLIGLPYQLATEDHLRSSQFFGQFGEIRKIIINKDKGYSRNYQTQTCSAYITFEKDIHATMAILGIDGGRWRKRFLKASFGMTKFCSYFLNGQKCPKDKCLFLHREAEKGDVVTVKDKTTQRVHVRVTKRNVIDFCIGLGPEEILEYEGWVESYYDDYDEEDFEIQGIIPVGEVLDDIKEEFRKVEGITLEMWKKRKIEKEKIKDQKKKQRKKKKKKKAIKKTGKKKTIGTWYYFYKNLKSTFCINN
jgi:hypothetical protein